MPTQTRQIPKLHTRAAFVPSTINEEARTVELTWSTGAQVRRFDWWTEKEWIEELSMDPAHVRLDRLNNGAPLLPNHRNYDLKNVIGVVERAWLTGNEGRAIVRFSDREDVKEIFNEVKAGILRNISVGYKINRLEEQSERKDDLKVFRAVDWEPMEISLVTIPADSGAQVRSESDDYSVQLITREAVMTDSVEKNKQTDEQRAANVPTESVKKPEINADEIRAQAAKDERERVASIRSFAKNARVPDGMIESLIERGTSLTEAKEQIIDAWAKKVDSETSRSDTSVIHDEKDKFVEAAAQAIRARAGLEPHDPNNEFRGLKLHEIARECAERAGVKTRGKSDMEYTREAFTQSTSDFPIILENAMHKTLQGAYATAQDVWSKFCATGSVSDFREHKRYRLGSFGTLDTLAENSEYKNKAIPDGESSKISVTTKGNIINVSRQMVVNDDLGAFMNLATMLGRAARRSIEADVFTLLNSNPTMDDGYALFSTEHGNIETTGVLLPTVAAIDAGRVKMAQQLDISGNDYLDIRPAFWVGSLAAGGTARVVNDAQYDPDTANKLQKPNMVRGLFREVVDTPRISTAWYMFADPNEAPVIEVAFLNGNQAPYLEQQQGFAVDGSQWKVRIDYGVGVIDYRGAFMNDGTP